MRNTISQSLLESFDLEFLAQLHSWGCEFIINNGHITECFNMSGDRVEVEVDR